MSFELTEESPIIDCCHFLNKESQGLNAGCGCHFGHTSVPSDKSQVFRLEEFYLIKVYPCLSPKYFSPYNHKGYFIEFLTTKMYFQTIIKKNDYEVLLLTKLIKFNTSGLY